jgi:GxxExxY protein
MEYLVRMVANHVWDSLGPGYSERVYHNAFEVALRLNSVSYETERIIPIFFQGHNVGNLRADLVIDQCMIVELKSIVRLKEENRNQIKNYMKLMKLDTGILVNFPSVSGSVEVEVYNTDPKGQTFMSDTSNEFTANSDSGTGTGSLCTGSSVGPFGC